MINGRESRVYIIIQRPKKIDNSERDKNDKCHAVETVKSKFVASLNQIVATVNFFLATARGSLVKHSGNFQKAD